MKKQILFFAVAVLIGHAIYTFNPKETLEKPLPFATHALLIFLDDSEIEMGAEASDLLVALAKKAAPILASTSLLAAIYYHPTPSDLIETEPENKLYRSLDARYKEITKRIQELIGSKDIVSLKDKEEIVAQLNKEFPPMPELKNADDRINAAAMREALSFNPDDWIIKVADSEKRLLLLIPRDYTNNGTPIDLKQYRPLTKRLSVNDPLTQTEYQTGLKVDHMETITSYEDAFPEQFTPKEYADYFMQAIWPRKIGANCSDIFVSNAEYTQAKRQSPRWLIYASGHGQTPSEQNNQQGRSIGLTLDMFKEFLDFINSKINTSIFVYISCYAVGTNMQLVYQDERKLAKTYSFIIITQGVTDSVTTTYSGYELDQFTLADIDFTNKTLEIAPDEDYVQFIKNFTSVPEVTDFRSAISPIMSLEQKKDYGVLEMPHIRLKGRDFFTLADTTHKIAIIGNIFAKTCTQVDLAKYFAKNGSTPEYYLVYAPYIPCELIITSLPNNKPYFIPMFRAEMGDTSIFEYHIQKITAPHLSLSELITTFTNTIPIYNSVHVQINDLNLKDGALLKTKEHEMVQLKDVHIVSQLQDSEFARTSKQYEELNREYNALLKQYEEPRKEYDLLYKEFQEKSAQKQFEEANALGTKMAEKHTALSKMDAQILQMSKQFTEIANKLTELSSENPQVTVNCYFMYNGVPYTCDKDGQPATPLTQDYRDTFKKSSAQPDRFEAISELQKKHIQLQKLRKTKTTD